MGNAGDHQVQRSYDQNQFKLVELRLARLAVGLERDWLGITPSSTLALSQPIKLRFDRYLH